MPGPGLNRLMGYGGGAPPGDSISRKARMIQNRAHYGDPAQIDAYWYGTPLRVVAALTADTFSIPVQQNAEFVAESLTGILADGSSGQIEPDALDGAFSSFGTLMITDTGSSRQMMDRALYWHNIVGTAMRPHYLSAPKHFAPNGTIQVTFTNLMNAVVWWQLVLSGVKIYGANKT